MTDSRDDALSEEQIEGFRVVLRNWTSRDSSVVQQRWDTLCDMALAAIRAAPPSSEAWWDAEAVESAARVLEYLGEQDHLMIASDLRAILAASPQPISKETK